MRLFLQTIKDAFIKAVSFDKKIFIKLYKNIPRIAFWICWFPSCVGLIFMLSLVALNCCVTGNFIGFLFIILLLVVVARFYLYLLFYVSERFPKLLQ